MTRKILATSALLALAFTSACETNQSGKGVNSAGSSVGSSLAGAARGAVSLVNVDLSNVLNKVAVDLKIDKANVPINAQIPITLAANICGVSINILSASAGSKPNCTATTTSPQLEQAVQQQLAANGSVGGGNQVAAPAPDRAPGTTQASGSTPANGTPPTGNNVSAPVTSNTTVKP